MHCCIGRSGIAALVEAALCITHADTDARNILSYRTDGTKEYHLRHCRRGQPAYPGFAAELIIRVYKKKNLRFDFLIYHQLCKKNLELLAQTAKRGKL